MFIEFLIVMILYIILVALICKGLFFLMKTAIVFSRITFSAFVAFAIHTQNALVENSWLNFGIWAAICVGLCLLLCKIPRFLFAFEFFCTSVISYVLVGMAVMAISSIAFPDRKPTVLMEVGLKVVCGAISFYALFGRIRESGGVELFTNPIAVTLERLMASVLYGLALLILVAVPLLGTWALTNTVILIVFPAAVVASFLADVFLLSNQ